MKNEKIKTLLREGFLDYFKKNKQEPEMEPQRTTDPHTEMREKVKSAMINAIMTIVATKYKASPSDIDSAIPMLDIHPIDECNTRFDVKIDLQWALPEDVSIGENEAIMLNQQFVNVLKQTHCSEMHMSTSTDKFYVKGIFHDITCN